MAHNTAIEWAHDTANLWWGCTEVHAGCDHCYAREFARGKGKGWGEDTPRFLTKAIWSNIFKWDRLAEKEGRQRRVFTGSMMDIFEKPKPVATWQGELIKSSWVIPAGPQKGHVIYGDPLTTRQVRQWWLEHVVPATPHLLHLLLTKRPSNIRRMVPQSWLQEWPRNVMVGTSVVDQETADTLVPQLLSVPGARRFLSCEPLLGPVDLGDYLHDGIEWVIVGGESGRQARPMHPDWPWALIAQCPANVKYFFKQWGAWSPYWMQGFKVKERFVFADAQEVYRRDKKVNGNYLTLGEKHMEVPDDHRDLHYTSP